jgi:hypothetical protein
MNRAPTDSGDVPKGDRLTDPGDVLPPALLYYTTTASAAGLPAFQPGVVSYRLVCCAASGKLSLARQPPAPGCTLSARARMRPKHVR